MNLIENQHNQGKTNLKGPQQTKQNHNARAPRKTNPVIRAETQNPIQIVRSKTLTKNRNKKIEIKKKTIQHLTSLHQHQHK